MNHALVIIIVNFFMGAIIRFDKNCIFMSVRLANLRQNTISYFIVLCKTNQGNAILVCMNLYNINYNMFIFIFGNAGMFLK